METWHIFSPLVNKYDQAVAIKLLPGDGIAIKVVVLLEPTDSIFGKPDQPLQVKTEEREQRMSMMNMDPSGFSAEHKDGQWGMYRWDQATSYCKRHLD